MKNRQLITKYNQKKTDAMWNQKQNCKKLSVLPTIFDLYFHTKVLMRPYVVMTICSLLFVIT